MNEEIASNFIELLKSTTFGWIVCKNEPACSEENVKIECGEQTRRKRDSTARIPLTVSFALRVLLSNESNASFDLNQTSLQISNDIITALETADMTLNVSGIVMVKDTLRPPEIHLSSIVCDEGQVQIGALCGKDTRQ